ncbi:hypothetical protein LY90DRAFT_619017 [Neocallimastix californiae]|uniref:Uncharacterized protein n=1 Tax=Neocallimastix californiae TaxID=1754190 RepID=A0A1Y2FTI3_9FUNG|nr:hypothetical protein LY90DRAFT_619017 [Neocallimastix californiae]|eukprot:ORY87331.1 hypothetical protein LY90DRAFT_619017 [Neocallimastix californiae]
MDSEISNDQEVISTTSETKKVVKRKHGRIESKRNFPKMKQCWLCCCFSFDFSIKLSTVLIIIWFLIYKTYSFVKKKFDIDIIIYIFVIISALIFLYGVHKRNSFCMNQYLNVFLLYLIYYFLYSNITLIKIFTMDSSRDDMKETIRTYFPETTDNNNIELFICFFKFFFIFFKIVPLMIYIYYFLAVGSYIETTESNISKLESIKSSEESIQ